VAAVRYVEAGGERISAIGLGTWQFGSAEWGYGRHYAEHDAPDIVARALERGVNLVDTAEMYGFGASERIVGAAIASERERVFLATKVLPILPLPSVLAWRAEGSARRLGVETIDLYQLHWPNPAVPLPTQFAGMRSLQRRGLVRHVGVSNYGLAGWQAAEAALGGPVLSNQVRASLLDRRAFEDLVPWAAAAGRVVIAYSPLAQGLLSGRYGPERRPGGMRGRLPAFLPENLERLSPLLEGLAAVGRAHDATPAQVALAWVVSHPNVVAIPGASSVGQVERNAEAADLELAPSELEELEALAAAYRPLPAPVGAAKVAVDALSRLLPLRAPTGRREQRG
jgi:aryl-alcohol dehydrogenase-like predicted oxidoreductase